MNIIREIQKHLFPKTLKCVYKKDILEYALKHHKYTFGENYNGLCITLIKSFNHYNINISTLRIIYYLPLFNINRAILFNINRAISFNVEQYYFGKINYTYYWWPKGEWDTGRLDFLKWLLEQYKDDKTNLKEL